MKKYIFLISLIIIPYAIFAQDIRYKELIEMIKQGKEQESYSVLFDFQKKNPDFANTYFQLGNIAYKWMINSDPLVDYDDTHYHIDNAKLFYSLGLAKIAEQSRDAKRYDDYYKTIPEFKDVKKLENQIVIDYMNEQYKKIEEYDSKTSEIVKLFHGLIRSYSKTKAKFLSFIAANDNLNTILIQPSKPTIDITNEIISLYDSTLYFYEQYKTALVNYPIKNYKQVLVEKPIITYRLEGLVGTNFLADTIYIWNYKAWAENIQKEVRSNIDHFRKTIEKTNLKLSNKDKELSKLKKSSNSFRTFYLDQIVGFEIEKYDYNSIISSLFKYRTARVNYLIQIKKPYNDRNNKSAVPSTRAKEYFQLLLDKQKIDSLWLVFNSKIDSTSYIKHKYFFDKYYGGFTGLKSFASKQNTDNTKRYKQAFSNFNYFIYRDVYFQSKDSQMIDYKDIKIPTRVNITEPENSEANKYYTLAKSSFNKDDYITGYYNTGKQCKAFVAKISNGNVEWLKLLKTAKGTTSFGVKIAAQETGCLYIVHSVDKDNVKKNTAIQLLSDGSEAFNKTIDNTNMPRFLDFDDMNADVLVAFKGEKLDAFSENDDNILYLNRINTFTGDLIIDKQITLEGNLTNILKINSKYYIFTNFKKMTYEQSSLSSESSSIGLLKLSEEGEFINMVKIATPQNVWLNYALKINDKTISLVAMKAKANMYKSSFESLAEMYNVIIAPDGKILYKN